VLVIFHSKCAAVLNLDENHLTGTLPSNIGSLAALSESSEVWLSFMTIKVIFSYTGLSFLIHTAALSMSGNSLRGTIPNEITSLTLLSKFYVVWFLVVANIAALSFTLILA
jgi:high-affinity K+ transport system ATPase subunit B